MTTTISTQSVVNSTTYIDLLGVLQGLSRIAGESSHAFAARVRRAGVLDRSASYQGLMNEIGLQFGFELAESIKVTGPADMRLWVDLAGVHVTSSSTSLTVLLPLATVDIDNFWAWNKLSSLVASLNAVPALSATLLTADGPAFTLVQQANNVLIVAEAIAGQVVRLSQRGLLVGSESFNQPVPTYTVDAKTSTLTFLSPLAAGVKATYRFVSSPFTLLTSPVCLMSLLDSEFAALASTPDGQLTYQVREMLNELLTRDGSYWAQ